ncbi:MULTISPECIES: hypothetical protein [Alkaliphilus]|uniref:Uncharacterized protein n=2 Tax=Alkaliphilus TaxID=114627 RepID=A0A833HL92_9FIRM|nr:MULTISPECIES: hypothetical protein [Alkaliphilus]KAB3525502.1 hypothetical protein F8153_15235 [Alkaliphilus serpentinus]KAB3538550.1 hypothetical protein F8154_01860 [Alkaliphilus pronyensis]
MYDNYIEAASETNADVNRYIDIALNDEEFRGMLVKEMIGNRKINVYYHSYIILSEVATVKPDTLACFLWDFASLLEHKNSYHRNYGMDLLSSIAKEVDDETLNKIIPSFCKLLYDEKISTRKYCITYSMRIINAKPNLSDFIVFSIIESFKEPEKNPKHRWLLIKEFIRLIEDTGLPLNNKLLEFFHSAINEAPSKAHVKTIKKLITTSSSKD